MKRLCLSLFIFVFVALLFTSCLTSEEHSTPMIGASWLYRTSLSGVTDSIRYGDTVRVGDTLYGPILLYGGYNNLTRFSVQVDTSAISMKLLNDSAYSNMLDADSNPDNGFLHFKIGCPFFSTSLFYVAKKTGDYKITMTLASDAGEKYSPQVAWYIQSVR